MILKLIKKILPHRFSVRRLDFEAPLNASPAAQDMERVFARLFASEDGQKVLQYLSTTTFMRAAGIDASDETLRYIEGQRALMANILRMIERGRQSPQ